MKIPKSINILGHVYKVQWKAIPGRYGECHYPARIIRLAPGLSGEMLKLTLLHEIRHAYQFESGTTQILTAQAMELDCESFASLVMSMKKQGVI